MKRAWIIVCLFAIFSNVATATILSSNQTVKFPSLNCYRYESEDVETLVKRVVPECVVDTFLFYTKDEENTFEQDTIRMYLLAVGEHESGWKVTRSRYMNNNGSYDLGYLMLNEYNLKDEIFAKYFFPKVEDNFKAVLSDQEFYVATCVNYYKYLYRKFGCDASYAYNCGEYRYKTGKLPESTYDYKLKITKYLNYYIDDLYTIAEERVSKQKMIESITFRLRMCRSLLLLEQTNPFLRQLYWICVKIQFHDSDFKIPHHSLYCLVYDSAKEIKSKLSKTKVIYYKSPFSESDEFFKRVIYEFQGEEPERITNSSTAEIIQIAI